MQCINPVQAKRNRQTHIGTLRYIATCRLTHSHMREFVAMCNLKATHHIIKRAKIQYNLVKRPSRATACCVSFVNLKIHIFAWLFAKDLFNVHEMHTHSTHLSLYRVYAFNAKCVRVCVCLWCLPVIFAHKMPYHMNEKWRATEQWAYTSKTARSYTQSQPTSFSRQLKWISPVCLVQFMKCIFSITRLYAMGNVCVCVLFSGFVDAVRAALCDQPSHAQ